MKLNSRFYDQDTDGLHKALEASILRNEVISEYNSYKEITYDFRVLGR